MNTATSHIVVVHSRDKEDYGGKPQSEKSVTIFLDGDEVALVR